MLYCIEVYHIKIEELSGAWEMRSSPHAEAQMPVVYSTEARRSLPAIAVERHTSCVRMYACVSVNVKERALEFAA